MSQHGDYPYTYIIGDDALLGRVVKALVSEERHSHNFEVWRDEGTIRVNDSGNECVARILSADTGATMDKMASPPPEEGPRVS
jgi:hypothetical protein